MVNLYYFQNLYHLEDHINILDIYKIFSHKFENQYNIYHFIHFFQENNIYSIIDNYPSINYFLKKYDPNGLLLFENIYFIYYYILNHQIENIDFNFINKYVNQNSNNLILNTFFDNLKNILNKNDFNQLITSYHLNHIEEDLFLNYFLLFAKKELNIYDNLNLLNKDIYQVKSSSLFELYKTLFRHDFKDDTQFYFFLKQNKHILDTHLFSTTFNDIHISNLTKKNNRHLSIYFLNNFLKKSCTLFSKKIFYILYPDFDLLFFKEVYDSYLIKNNINCEDELEIMNYYYQYYIKDTNEYQEISKNNQYPSLIFHSIKHVLKHYHYIDFDLVKEVYLNTTDHLTQISVLKFIINNKNIIYNNQVFLNTYKHFNLKLFFYFNFGCFKNNNDIIKYLIHNQNCIYSVETFLNQHINFNINFYKEFYDLDINNKDEIIFHYCFNKKSSTLINENDILKSYNIEFIKILNQKLNNIDNIQLCKLLIKNNSFITHVQDFIDFYLNQFNLYKKYLDNDYILKFIDILHKLKNEQDILYFIKQDVYTFEFNKNYIGRKNVFFIEEVLIDLEKPKPKLKNGVSLIIRAKNEEKNIKVCIESVVDLVDEIIFVNNNSTDNTLKLIEEYALKYPKIKVYNYFINVNKAGTQHAEAIKNNDKNTLGQFYNWCLSKATMKNIIKWDADFICIRNNFKRMLKNYDVINKNEHYALWFTGYTLFINQQKCFINLYSYYDEFRLFSYENGYKWHDGELCEYNVPYLEACSHKYYFKAPLFYEIKRTNEDEFSSRSSLLDNRDLNDFNLLKALKNNETNECHYKNLLEFNHKNINKIFNVVILTNSLGAGGSNIFVIELYQFFKFLGFNVYIFTESIDKKNNIFNIIEENDIFKIHEIQSFIEMYSIDYIFFNSYVHDHFHFLLDKTNDIYKLFITHSDVAYSNYYIKKYHKIFNKILTVNQYTKNKLIKFLNIQENKIQSIVNYKNFNINNHINSHEDNTQKKYKFGVITRFSDDKNIIMLLFSLQKLFLNKDYQHYKFYLVGYENDTIDLFMHFLVKYLNIEKYVYFEGYQNNTKKYYDLFDFIILPSVSEGCSYNVLESMFYEKIIILSDVGGNNELFPNNTAFFIEYDGIKEFEQSHLYITDYHGQLEEIGYLINDEQLFKKYDIDIDFNIKELNVIPPSFLKPIHKKYLERYKNILNTWNKNVNQIFNCIKKVIHLDIDTEKSFKIQNKKFIDNHFNKYNYYSSLLDLIYE